MAEEAEGLEEGFSAPDEDSIGPESVKTTTTRSGTVRHYKSVVCPVCGRPIVKHNILAHVRAHDAQEVEAATSARGGEGARERTMTEARNSTPDSPAARLRIEIGAMEVIAGALSELSDTSARRVLLHVEDVLGVWGPGRPMGKKK